MMVRMTGNSWLRCWLLAVLGMGALGTLAADVGLTEKQAVFLDNSGRGRLVGRWFDLDTNQLVALRQKVESHSANLTRHHLVGGLVVSVRYSDTNRSQVVRYENLEQSSAWTGFYLSGLGYWYAVDRRPETLERIRTTLDGVETLLDVSGRPGYLPAFAGKAQDPAFRAVYTNFGGVDPARPGFGKLAFTGTGAHADQVWLAGVSRENYTGLLLGLATVQKYVRETKTRSRVSNIVEGIVTRFTEDHWRLRDGKGQEAYISPLLAAAALRVASSINTNRYLKEYEVRARDLIDLPPPTAPRYGDLQSAVFAAANLATLTALEPAGRRKLSYQEKLTRLWRDGSSQLNPWLAATYVNAFDHAPPDAISTATLQGGLLLFPSAPRWSHAAGPTNELDVLTANDSVWARHSRPLSDRAVAPFQWTVTATSLNPGADDPVAHPGLDLFTPYWMARDAGVIPDETAALNSNPSGLRRGFEVRGRTNVPLALPPNTGAGNPDASRPKP
jgi:hypothetical protein